MGHSHRGHLVADPVNVSDAITLYLQESGATPDPPIAVFLHGSKWRWIFSAKITAALYLNEKYSGPKTGLLPKDIRSNSMKSFSTMYLIMG